MSMRAKWVTKKPWPEWAIILICSVVGFALMILALLYISSWAK